MVVNENEVTKQLNILTDKTVQHSKQLEQVSKLLDKIVSDLYGETLEQYIS
jgi:hypothetical protein